MVGSHLPLVGHPALKAVGTTCPMVDGLVRKKVHAGIAVNHTEAPSPMPTCWATVIRGDIHNEKPASKVL